MKILLIFVLMISAINMILAISVYEFHSVLGWLTASLMALANLISLYEEE